MGKISPFGLALLLVICGCTESNQPLSRSESVECQRMKELWEHISAENPRIVIPEMETQPETEMGWEEFGESLFASAGCCFCKPHPSVQEWQEYNRLECIREYLENERVLAISFYEQVMYDDATRPEDWRPWAKITDAEKVREILRLLFRAMGNEKDRFANEGIVLSHSDRMQIVTDKHKFIIPIGCNSRGKKVICGIGWESYELRRKLEKWGFGDAK